MYPAVRDCLLEAESGSDDAYYYNGTITYVRILVTTMHNITLDMSACTDLLNICHA